MANLGGYANSAPSIVNAVLTHKESVEANVGDMLYLDPADSNKAKPASSFTDQGDAEKTQRSFAAMFAGLSLTRQLSTDSTARPGRSLIDTIVTFPCASTTVEYGDYFAPTYTAGVLSDQQLTKVTDPTRAIARAVRRYSTSTTTVEVRMTSPRLNGMGFDTTSQSRVKAPSGDAAGEAGDVASHQGGDGAPHTSGTAGAGGAGTYGGGSGGNATTGTGGAGGASTFGGTAGGTATTGTGGAGGASTVSAGAGGAATGAAGVGGAGGAFVGSGGVGGAASNASSGNAGAGGAWTGQGGAGGAATGTTTAAGGAGGAWTGGGGAGGAAAGTSAGGAGGATTLSSGAGGAKTGTGAAAGGAAGALNITGGAGGATASSGSDAGGAGATITITAGAGGAASAGTGNGGAGGNLALAGGAGGATTGGTAGARGLVTATGLVTKAGTTAVAITGATTLTQADSGGIFTVSQGSAYDIDLPSPTTGPGLSYFFSLTAPASNNVTVTVAGGAATFVGSVITEGKIVVATGSTLTFASGVCVLGDSIEVRSIATNLYHVRAVSSIVDGVTIA